MYSYPEIEKNHFPNLLRLFKMPLILLSSNEMVDRYFSNISRVKEKKRKKTASPKSLFL